MPTFACGGVEEGSSTTSEAAMAGLDAPSTLTGWTGLGVRPARPPAVLVRLHHLSLADPVRSRRRSEFVITVAAPEAGVRPAAPVPGAVRPQSLGDPILTSVGAVVSRRPGEIPLSDSRLYSVPHCGGSSGSVQRGFGKRDPLDMVIMDDHCHPRHHRLDDRAPGVHPPSQAQGGQHREQVVLRLPVDQAAQKSRTTPTGKIPVEQLRSNNVWIALRILRGMTYEAPGQEPSAWTRSC